MRPLVLGGYGSAVGIRADSRNESIKSTVMTVLSIPPFLPHVSCDSHTTKPALK